VIAHVRKGQMLRARNASNPDGLVGVAMLVGGSDPQSVAMAFRQETAIRDGQGGMHIAFMLPLLIGYGDEKVTDILTGAEWEIDVSDGET
jgi:hypothetical protein